jgi:hypothetical protein
MAGHLLLALLSLVQGLRHQEQRTAIALGFCLNSPHRISDLKSLLLSVSKCGKLCVVVNGAHGVDKT